MNININKRLIKNCVKQIVRFKSKSSSEYCLETVKQYDYENYVCTLLLKDHARTSAFAIRGFNVEIARIGELVTQPGIGEMRMKFWEEALDSCYSNDFSRVPQHPVAVELYKAISKTKLTRRYFNTLITSRAERLKINTFKTIEELEKYADQSVSNVYFLILEGCGVKNVNADHAASHLGKAQGIVQQLRSVLHARQLNMISFPQEVLAKNRVSQEEILRGKASEGMVESTFEIASRAHQHLTKARSLRDSVPVEARSSLLPAIVVENYLNRLQKVNYNVFHPSLKHRAWIWLPKLWFSNVRNMY